MSDIPTGTGDSGIIMYIVGGIVTFLSGLGLYNHKKLNEVPEKYIMKEDCVKSNLADKFVMKDDCGKSSGNLKADFETLRKEVREDMRITRTEILSAISRLHERLDK